MELDATHRRPKNNRKPQGTKLMKCYGCGKMGHKRSECRSPKRNHAVPKRNASWTTRVDVDLDLTTDLDWDRPLHRFKEKSFVLDFPNFNYWTQQQAKLHQEWLAKRHQDHPDDAPGKTATNPHKRPEPTHDYDAERFRYSQSDSDQESAHDSQEQQEFTQANDQTPKKRKVADARRLHQIGTANGDRLYQAQRNERVRTGYDHDLDFQENDGRPWDNEFRAELQDKRDECLRRYSSQLTSQVRRKNLLQLLEKIEDYLLKQDHAAMSFTACTDDNCPIHLGEKEGSNYFPFDKRNVMEESEPADCPLKLHGLYQWEYCYEDSCEEHEDDKRDHGWFPKVHQLGFCKKFWQDCEDDRCETHLFWKRYQGVLPRHALDSGHTCNADHWTSCQQVNCDKHEWEASKNGFLAYVYTNAPKNGKAYS